MMRLAFISGSMCSRFKPRIGCFCSIGSAVRRILDGGKVNKRQNSASVVMLLEVVVMLFRIHLSSL